jgi:hypothetical protein
MDDADKSAATSHDCVKLVHRFVHSAKAPAWTGHSYHPAPGSSLAAVAAGKDRLSVFDLRSPSTGLAEFCVPISADCLAVHPDLGKIAILAKDELLIADSLGKTLVSASSPLKFGKSRSLLFDRTGRLLFLSGELADAENSESPHVVSMLDSASLRLLDSTAIEGSSEGYHFIGYHPHRKLIMIDVACGQDGSWLTLLKHDECGFGQRVCLAAPNDPFCPAGFSMDGNFLACVRSDRISVWDSTQGQSIAEAPMKDNEFLEFESGYWTDMLVSFVRDVKRDEWRCQLRSMPNLELRKDVRIEFSEEVDCIHNLGHLVLLTEHLTYAEFHSPADRKPKNRVTCMWGLSL